MQLDEEYHLKERVGEGITTAYEKAVELNTTYGISDKVTSALYSGLSSLYSAAVAYSSPPEGDE